jgi:hypothetical protein
VCKFNPRKSLRIFLKLSPVGMGVLSHSGSLVIFRFFPGGPTMTVLSSRASSWERGASEAPVKWCNEGPAFNRSEKDVTGR